MKPPKKQRENNKIPNWHKLKLNKSDRKKLKAGLNGTPRGTRRR